ncbi:clostripain-related cysteine peptidase [uncultured Bacteroides sp.]|uniref:clostripain-related cysteine peptidase n=1 Tax=uncultured Bacteroides sp. TaxID=162156 RepID=UPI00260462A3|nr:clostripain-related cysteine peptidase [uncultured Bacteroides sp.]
MVNRIFTSFFVLITLFLFNACSSDSSEDIPTPPGSVDKTHTLLIYMMGDSNGLQPFMDKNIRQILSVLDQKPDNGRIALFYDQGNYTRLTELVIENGVGRQELLAEYPINETTANPDFMRLVFKAVKENLPSDSYGLVLSSHGGGWVPANVFDAHIAESEQKLYQENSRFFGQDKSECMELPEIASVLKDFTFDYILFDACFMASVEGLYDLRNCTDYVIASSAEVVGNGFPYAEILPYFFQGDLGLKKICEEYMKYYREGNADWVSATISLIDMKSMDELAEAT